MFFDISQTDITIVYKQILQTKQTETGKTTIDTTNLHPVRAIKGFFTGKSISDEDLAAVKAYNTEFNNLRQAAINAGKDVSNFKMTQEQTNAVMVNASDNAKNIVAGADGAAVSIKGLEASSKAATVAMKALSLAGNMLIVGLVTTAISKVITLYDDYKHKAENARNSSEKLTTEYENEQKSIDQCIAEYKELSQTLKDHNLSSSEILSVKEKLTSVQKTLNSKYNDEGVQLDLINGKYDEQIAKLKEISKNKAKKFRDKNYNNNKEDKKFLNEVVSSNYVIKTPKDIKSFQTYSSYLKEHNVDLTSLLDKYSALSLGNGDEDGVLKLKGTREEITTQIHQLIEDLKNEYGESNLVVDNLRSSLNGLLDNDNYNEDDISSARKNVVKYAENSIALDDAAANAYDNLTQAVEAYNKALANGEGTDTAEKNLLDAKKTAEDSTKNITDAGYALQEVYNTLSGSAPIALRVKLGVDTEDEEQKLTDEKDTKDKLDKLVDKYSQKTTYSKEESKKNQNDLKNAKQNLKKESKKISNWGLEDYATAIKNGSISSKYGNVDMDNRKIIKYDKEYVKQHADILKSWADEVDKDGNVIRTKYQTITEALNNGESVIDTVYGGSKRYGENINGKGWEVAFTPILPNGQFLSSKTVDEYFKQLIEDAYADDGKVTDDELIKLDAQGRLMGDTVVHGIYAAIDDSEKYDNNGNWAEVVGRLMHFSGKNGAWQLGEKEKKTAEGKISGGNVDQQSIKDWLYQLSDDDKQIAKSKDFEKALKSKQKELHKTTLSLKDYKDAMNTVKGVDSSASADSTVSFEEAWKGLKNYKDADGNVKDVSKDLLDLAKSGELTDKTLETTTEYNSLLVQTGLSAKEARSRISDLLTEQEKVAGFQTQAGNLATAYNEFKDKKFVTAETLESLPDVFKNMNNGKSFDIFSKIVGDPKSGKKKIKQAFNELITEYAKDQFLLKGVTEKTKSSVVANLKEAGVTNAEQAVDNYIKNREKKTKASNAVLSKAETELTNKTASERETDLANLQSVLEKKNYSHTDLVNAVGEDNAKLIVMLGEQYKKDYANWNKTLNAKLKAEKRFKAAVAIDNIDVGQYGAKTASGAAEIKDSQNHYKKLSKAERKAYKRLKKLLKQGDEFKLDYDDLSFDPPDTSSSSGKGSKSGSDKSSSSKQTIDWIERALNSVSSTLDLIKAKAENLFGTNSLKTLQKQEASLKSQYNILKKQYDYQNKAEKKYLAKANSVKLSSSLKKAVQNGRISGSLKQLIATYGEKTATRIQNYQDYWDKAQDQKKTKEETRKAMRENLSDRYQLHIDDADARKSRNEADLENLTTAKSKAKVLKDTFKHIATSYDYQIKQAKLENNDVKVAELKAQKKKEQRETEVQILQNYADEYEATVSLYEAQSSSTTNLTKKNSLLSKSIPVLKNQYDKLIAIAKKEGNITEQKRLQNEYQDKLNEKLKAQFDNVVAEYEYQQTGYQQRTDSINNAVSLSEAKGHYAGKAFYQNLQNSQKDSLKSLEAERDSIIKKRQEAIANGLKLDSEQYREMTKQIWTADRNIEQMNTDIANTAKQIREAKYALDEFTQTRIDERNNEAEFYKTIMGYKDSFDKNGNITGDGLGTLTSDVFEIQNNMAKVEEYKKSLADLDAQYKRGDMGYEEFITKNQSLTESMRDAESQVYSLKDAIKSLIEDGLNKQLDALNELIEKYKKTLDSAKDLREYNKNIAEQTKNITTIQKQFAALNGDTSEEGRARIQKLQVSLKDAKEQLEDTEYDKRMSDIENILTDLTDDFQDFINDQMDHIDGLVDKIITAITVNSGVSGEKIIELAKQLGFTLSDSLLNFIKNGNNTTDKDANAETDKKSQEDSKDAIKQVTDFAKQQLKENNSVAEGTAQANHKKAEEAKKNSGSSTKGSYNFINGGIATKINQGDGKVSYNDIGKKGTLKKGATYYDYALAGGVKKGDKGHTTKAAHAVTIAAIDQNGNAKLKSATKALNGVWIPKSKLKYLQGFSQGGRVGDLQNIVRMNGDDGVTINTLKKGEEVLTPYNADLFDQFVDFLPDLVDYNNNLVDMLRPINVPATKVRTGDLTLNIDNIELPNVTDPKEFSAGLIAAMQQDKKLQRFWGDATAGSLNNNMSGIYKY